jgi:hypothetical protein
MRGEKIVEERLVIRRKFKRQIRKIFTLQAVP